MTSYVHFFAFFSTRSLFAYVQYFSRNKTYFKIIIRRISIFAHSQGSPGSNPRFFVCTKDVCILGSTSGPRNIL